MRMFRGAATDRRTQRGLRAVVAALAVASGLSAVSAQAKPPTENAYSCTVNVGAPSLTFDARAYFDPPLNTVPLSGGACRVVVVDSHAVVKAITKPDACTALADVNGDVSKETPLRVGFPLSPGTEVWSSCAAGSVNSTTTVVLEEVPLKKPGEVERIEPFEVVTRDGQHLRGHVYVPKGHKRVGTVLEFSPYWNTEYGLSDQQETTANGRRTMKGWLRPFMDAGFAVALINIRGSGLSEGCLLWGNEAEWDDAYRVVEALADAPWSNGKIGMFGLSYPGWTQWMAVAKRPPSLKAIAPSSAVIDFHSLATRGGSPTIAGPAAHSLWATGAGLGGFFTVKVLTRDRFVPVTSPDHATCPNYVTDTSTNLALAANGDRNDWFDQRDLRPHMRGSTVPAFVAGGLTFNDGSSTQIEGVWDMLAGPKRMMLGQWGHDLPTKPEYAWQVVGWFEQYLGDGKQSVAPGVAEYQDSTGNWHTASSWPPPGTKQTLKLSKLALVADGAPVESSARSFQSSGASHMRACSGPDYVRYVSEPLKEDMLLAGNYQVDLTLSSNLPDGTLGIRLWEVTGQGGCGDPHFDIGRAPSTLRHGNDVNYGKDFPLNTPTTVSIRSMPFARKVSAGSRIVLTVGSDDSEQMPNPQKPRITVHTGPDIVGSVRLPVVSD